MSLSLRRPAGALAEKTCRSVHRGTCLRAKTVNAYLSREHFDDRDGSCPIIALPSDVARGGKGVKTAFRQVLDKMVEVFAANLARARTRSGGVVRGRDGGRQGGG